MELALAQVRDLQKRLFSTKSEQGRPCESRSKAATCRKRGQQRGTVGHGRTLEPQLSERHEDVVLETAQCPECGLALKEFAGTEDAQVLEIEVNAYRRVIHRHRYAPTCECGCVSGIVTAPSPARFINRGKFGISVWASVLLDKFVYGRSSQRYGFQGQGQVRHNSVAKTYMQLPRWPILIRQCGSVLSDSTRPQCLRIFLSANSSPI